MRARGAALAVATLLSGLSAAGCVAPPDYDFDYHVAYPPLVQEEALVYARSRVVRARAATWAGWAALATGLIGAAISTGVAIKYHRLDRRNHWDAPWELWTGLAVGGGLLGGWGAAEAKIHRDSWRQWELELQRLESQPGSAGPDRPAPAGKPPGVKKADPAPAGPPD